MTDLWYLGLGVGGFVALALMTYGFQRLKAKE